MLKFFHLRKSESLPQLQNQAGLKKSLKKDRNGNNAIFFDTSAIVKIYHQEEGSEIVLPVYLEDKTIIISELSKVEFLSTIHKKFRNNEIGLNALEALGKRFLADSSDKYIVIPIVSSIIDSALDLYEKYGKSNHLFSLDALQITTFTAVSDNDTIFVCADKKMTSFVENLGYSVLEI